MFWFFIHPVRLDFRRLPGPVFDSPRRETAGRVTRWPCLWRNWKIDNLGVSDVTESETGLQFSYLFGSKIASSAPSHPNDFRNSFFGTFPYIVKNILRHISVHGDMYLIFFDLRIFWILVTSYGSELTDSWKQTKLNGKVSDLPDRISNKLNVPLSNINVDGCISDICNEHSYRSRPKAP